MNLALAELFYDPKRGEEIINKLIDVFVPRGFDSMSDRIVKDVRPGSVVINVSVPPACNQILSTGLM